LPAGTFTPGIELPDGDELRWAGRKSLYLKQQNRQGIEKKDSEDTSGIVLLYNWNHYFLVDLQGPGYPYDQIGIEE
jgi:hypothetical protein